MTKYTVTKDNVTTEYLSLEEATNAANKLTGAILNYYDDNIIIESKRFSNITSRQIRLALVEKGFSLTSIDNLLNTLPDNIKEIAKISWEYSLYYERDNDFIKTLGPSLGFTEAQLDELWEYAVTL